LAFGSDVSIAARIAAMCSLVVPQHPPTIRAPLDIASVANVAKYSGEER
jgi:hypothetical protein